MSIYILDLHSEDMDTLSGLLMEHVGQMLSPGKFVDLESGIKAEVAEVEANRATRVRLTIPGSLNEDSPDEPGKEGVI